MASTDYSENIYWVYAMVAETEALANETVKKLNDKQIGTRPFFWCMHEQPIFQKMGFLGMNVILWRRNWHAMDFMSRADWV